MTSQPRPRYRFGVRGFLSPLPDGDAGTFATLRAMQELSRRAALVPMVRQTAGQLVQAVPYDKGNVHADLIRRWIEPRVYFLADPTYAEALHAPEWSLRQILTRGTVGLDCDDVAMLAAALGLSIGLRARFVAVGFNSPEAPFRHVWTDLAALNRPAWVSVDPTRDTQGLGRFDIRRVAYYEV